MGVGESRMKGLRVSVVLKSDGISKTDILKSVHSRSQWEENSQTRDSSPEQVRTHEGQASEDSTAKGLGGQGTTKRPSIRTGVVLEGQ